MWLQDFKLNWYDDRQTKKLANSGAYDPVSAPEYILDLGAHKGFVTEHYAKKYPNAVIHAYEPNPAVFAVLKRRLHKYTNVQVFDEAVSGESGTRDLFLDERNVASSFFGHGRAKSVNCITLDTAVSRIGGSPIFLKIDIEGAEFEVLEIVPSGIREIIGESHPEKAGQANEKLERMLRSQFTHVSVGAGKSIFYARKRYDFQ